VAHRNIALGSDPQIVCAPVLQRVEHTLHVVLNDRPIIQVDDYCYRAHITAEFDSKTLKRR
jgi:hypothetical protein